ncbi:putative bifunctional diguanylate cyclase/phosphodiesterase [Marinomonas sp. IMCC 4694]|uniref:putative bifunctional diguanylate cyclase/phosphodiesterase n=1 Tax=Marinomonas sp. IMCC 4694 TaxID=2605432 RepID=UPI0011E6EEE2|nr:EAL domain-containing protein [Marinomonas sp. IMCC 4694]TYL47527.1 EAL domain-containing protein [Marinomonas sp. IMCC 4694]
MTDLSELLQRKMPVAAWVIDIEESSVPWSNEAAKILLKDSLSSIKLGQRVISDALKERLSGYLEALDVGDVLPFKWPFVAKDGSRFRVSGSVISLGGTKKGLSVEAHRVIDLKSREAMSNVAILSQFTTLSFVVFDHGGVFVDASACFTEQFGDVAQVSDLFAVAGAANSFIRRLLDREPMLQEIRLSTIHGVRWHNIEVSYSPSRQYVYVLVHDIQEERDHEIALYRLNNYDGLTHLPNRHLLYQQLESALVNARKRHRQFGLLYLDLDGFKVINDNFGHRVGDELIQRVAERIKDSIPSGACLYRLGGDEFVVVLEKTQSVEELENIAQSIMQNASNTYPVAKMEMTITASIGIASYPQHAADIDNLLKNADAAMYRAKSKGHNLYFVYENHMAENINAHLTLGGGLRKAIDEEQFVLHYQPKVRLCDEAVVGAEALIRWVHPELGMISPDQFIPLAEESGLILPLGEWVIRRACRQLQEWRESGLAPINMSVNLSSRQFMQVDLVDMVKRTLEETGVDAQFFELELTESMLMADAQQSIEKLHSFRELGLTLSIDDFGTGYSSLAYLKKFPIQTLKIDRSFVHDLGQGCDNDAIVKATITMANGLNLKVIAEGVEKRSQVEALNRYGCQEVQGYLFSKPLSSDDFLAFIKAYNERCPLGKSIEVNTAPSDTLK